MIGKQLLHYKIVEKIGAGGMGEVYRARDSKLDREVAIKILPESFAGDGDRLARFEREAKLLASLNHPNIASIHGIEEADSTRFLVLELVEGEDLSERIARGAIPVDEALGIAHQIAEALEEAHGQGVIHRDLKPANIKITPDGKVRVLDFGLAKALDSNPESSSPALTQPITLGATVQGVILGTPAYMSPEQAQGKPVDHRTDIWAFGCVVYEMLTGRPCYTGETVTDVLAGILHREPDLESLPELKPGMRRVLSRCLRKDAQKRIQHIGDVRIEIDDVIAGVTETVKPAATGGRRWMGWAISGLVGVLVGVVGVIQFAPGDSEDAAAPGARFTVTAPGAMRALQNPTLSPNGRLLAYLTSEGVHIHDLEANESHALPSMKDANQFVFFSPNSDWIAFHAGGKLQKIRVTGGVPLDLIDLGAHPGAAWGSRNTIVYPETWTSGLYEISADGGEPRQITTLDKDQGETGHWSPSFLPDGRHVLFTVFTTRGSLKHSRMDLVDLDTGERVSLGIGAYPIYLTSGHIIYHRSGLYEMAPFDIKEKKITGSAKIVMEDVTPVAPHGTYTRYFSLSGNGVLAFIDVDDSEVAPRTFHRLDRAGKLGRLFPPPAMHWGEFDVSPEGTRLVSSVFADGEYDLWVYDLEHQTSRRVTRESNNIRPYWHPDGRRIAFTSTRLGTYDAFGLDIDSGESPAPLLTSQQDVSPSCWAPDGSLIAVMSTVDQADNLVILKEGTTSNLVATDAQESNASVSGSGRWIAYTSERSGIQEVYVQQLTHGGAAIQISTGGGNNPQWSRASNELFYGKGPTLGEIMRVSYEDQDGRFVASRSVPFLRDTSQDGAGELPLVAARVFGEFAVSLHGELIVSLYETTPAPSVHIVLDGFGELERQAAAER